MVTDCPSCGEPSTGAVATGPGIEKIIPCGCCVAFDGGSVQGDDSEGGSQYKDGTDRTRVGHCRRDSTDVYAGRGDGGDADMLNTPVGDHGWLGNPFTVDEWSRGEAVSNYRCIFEWRIQADPDFLEAVRDLAGKTLGCWCQSLEDDGPACHAEVVADYADRLAGGEGVV